MLFAILHLFKMKGSIFINMENSENKATIVIAREFVLYVSRNKKSWKIIDELYYRNYDRCVEIEDEVKEKLKQFNINLNKESVENTCYLNRLTSLLILDEQCGSFDNIMSVISKAFNKTYKYAMSNSIIRLSSFKKRKINSNDSIDNIFSEILCLLAIAMIYGKKIDTDDEMFSSLMESLLALEAVDNGLVKLQFSHENCKKDRKSLINELELILRGKYFYTGYNIEGLHDFLEEKRCFGNTGNRKLYTSRTKDDIYCKMYCSIEYTDGILGKTNAGALLKDIEIKKDVVKDFINAYLVLNGYDDQEQDITISKNDINLEELSTYVAVSIIQALYLEAYGNTYKFFFENYNDNINAKYKELLNEGRDVKKNNLKLQDENEKVKIENEELKRRLSKLEKELEKSKTNNKELFELRNYIFNNQEDETNIIEENINLKYLEGKKAVCFGGNKAWISSMSKEFDWAFVPADAINFDAAILKDADIVFIKATHISHAMYYKVIANLGEETEIKFINNNNINRIKEELSNV